ncbi:MAG: RNA-binding S4 domain-containing protein [Bacteroidales bacterium]|nr:RNA-binding S4 domain-containing protein [Bacteroidales bacterium]
MEFELTGEYIELNKLLKALNIASSGGMAGEMIAAGEVLRNGMPELRKRAKIRTGDKIKVLGQLVSVT